MNAVVVASSTCEVAEARPLIVRFGALGDMVILTVLVRALHARFGMDIDIACGPQARALLERQPGVGRIFSLYTRQLPYAFNPQQWSFVARLRERGPGPVWVCQTDEISHSLLARAGYDRKWRVSQRDYPALPGEHAVDRLLRMADAPVPALACPGQSRSVEQHAGSLRFAPRLIVPASWHDDANAWLAKHGLAGRPLVLIQAGNKRTMRLGARRRARNKKYWPEAYWAAVIDEVQRRVPGAAVLLLGVALESLLNRTILRHTRMAGAIDVAGDVPMPRLLALCARAQSMISVDTGPAHVAAAVGCPLVVMFGHQEPSYYAPRSESSAVEVVVGSRDAEYPLLDITPDVVLAAWERLPSRAASEAPLESRAGSIE